MVRDLAERVKSRELTPEEAKREVLEMRHHHAPYEHKCSWVGLPLAIFGGLLCFLPFMARQTGVEMLSLCICGVRDHPVKNEAWSDVSGDECGSASLGSLIYYYCHWYYLHLSALRRPCTPSRQSSSPWCSIVVVWRFLANFKRGKPDHSSDGLSPYLLEGLLCVFKTTRHR